MIPAHIDKTANSLLANLAFIPPDSQFTCAEIKDMSKYHELKSSILSGTLPYHQRF